LFLQHDMQKSECMWHMWPSSRPEQLEIE
jgi:hypothetical protein